MATAFNSTNLTTNPRPDLKDKEETQSKAKKLLDDSFDTLQQEALIQPLFPNSALYGPNGGP